MNYEDSAAPLRSRYPHASDDNTDNGSNARNSGIDINAVAPCTYATWAAFYDFSGAINSGNK